RPRDRRSLLSGGPHFLRAGSRRSPPHSARERVGGRRLLVRQSASLARSRLPLQRGGSRPSARRSSGVSLGAFQESLDRGETAGQRRDGPRNQRAHLQLVGVAPASARPGIPGSPARAAVDPASHRQSSPPLLHGDPPPSAPADMDRTAPGSPRAAPRRCPDGPPALSLLEPA